MLPWDKYDGALAPGVRDYSYSGGKVLPENQIEGAAKLHHKSGWTALAWWDRSADTRSGSNAVLFAEGTHAFEDMLNILQTQFPSVANRLQYKIFEAEQ